ncbi:MAG: hypothetical protein RBG13Loki_0497 [Promethearchaeota archaeon CR_4]|nr:MAG: hypothetical protein RBG13Loki_0497 [Candidatus Lokiarchaeota archaeon CR_4]
MSYGEKTRGGKKEPPIPTSQIINSDILPPIENLDLTPLEEIIRKVPISNIDDIRDPVLRLEAEGTQAFESGDSFSGGEKFKQAMDLLIKEKRKQELVRILADAASLSFHSNHLQLVKDFARRLLKYGEEIGSLVHMGQAHYFIGAAYLREKENATKGLEYLVQASISFDKSGEFVVAGLCDQLIGDHYLAQQNLFQADLYYIEAIKFYQKGRHESPLLQKLAKMNPSDVDKKLATLIADLKSNLTKLTDPKERSKIDTELKKLKL